MRVPALGLEFSAGSGRFTTVRSTMFVHGLLNPSFLSECLHLPSVATLDSFFHVG